ncbi:hypothetical protein [Streptomyces massasporeus]|uniref:hypothetical protein n=1 Tax=Streptomyces massasporeus TaxID=67324 RepID=UPI0036D002D1
MSLAASLPGAAAHPAWPPASCPRRHVERRQVLPDVLADLWLAEPAWATADLSEALHRYEALEDTGAGPAVGFMEASCAQWYVLYEAAVV